MRAAVDLLSRHLESWNEPDLASAVKATLDGPQQGLPARVVGLFKHGMEGLLDRPLRRRNGEVDAQATHRRDLLADDLWTVARECLSTDTRA